MSKVKVFFVAVMIFFVIFACGKGSSSDKSKSNANQGTNKNHELLAKTSKKQLSEGKTIFETRCAVCHGIGGQGDGPTSKGFDPPPRDLTSIDWQKEVTDEYINKIVKYGGAAVGKSASMPANPDLSDNEEIIQAIVQYVRSLKKK